jgi:hypothetical protein
MSFKELLHELHNSYPQPNPMYYHTLLDNAAIILMETARRNQSVVARDLGMTYQSFNRLFPVLKEYSVTQGHQQ